MLNTADSKRQFPVAGFGVPGLMRNGVGKILWANLTARSCNLAKPPAPPLNLFTSCNSLLTDFEQITESDLWTRSSVLSSGHSLTCSCSHASHAGCPRGAGCPMGAGCLAFSNVQFLVFKILAHREESVG